MKLLGTLGREKGERRKRDSFQYSLFGAAGEERKKKRGPKDDRDLREKGEGKRG